MSRPARTPLAGLPLLLAVALLLASDSAANAALVGGTNWTLLTQTNNLHLGVSANPSDWMRVPGSSATNSVVIPILPTTPGVYYRLVYP